MDEKYLVIANRGFEKEDIFYVGDSLLIAYRRLKELPDRNKEVILATVKMCTMFGEYEMVESYEVIKKIS